MKTSKSSLSSESIGKFFAIIFIFIITKQTIWYIETNYEQFHSGYFECISIISGINIILLAIIGFLDTKLLKKPVIIIFVIFAIEAIIKTQYKKEFLTEFSFYIQWKDSWTTFVKFLWHFCLDILVLFTVVFIKIFFMKLGNISKRA